MPSSAPSTNTPTLADALADLPARVRVHEIARRGGVNSKEAIAALGDAGVEVRSASSSVDREVAETLLTSLLATGPRGKKSPAKSSGVPAAKTRGSSGDAGTAHRQSRAAGDQGADRKPDGKTKAKPDDKPQTKSGGKPQAHDEADSGDKAHDTTKSADKAEPDDATDGSTAGNGSAEGSGTSRSRRRRRGGRGRRGGKGKGSGQGESPADGASESAGASQTPDSAGKQRESDDASSDEQRSSQHDQQSDDSQSASQSDDADESGGSGSSNSRRRRRRRRRRSGSSGGSASGDGSSGNDQQSGKSASVQSVKGSTRLEAKRQRRRDSRDSRRRPQILSESEFLARRESVDRVMAVRQHDDVTQVALLEDGVLVEHFVSRRGSGSMIGNVYLGRVQNVLPSMEAAFVDIGKGRNAVLYAGEVNWDIAGLEGKQRRIEMALSGGDQVLVQASKDPIGHKGARLTTQVSLPGRFLVYVPNGNATGISRKLPDTERKRLKKILDKIVPEDAGVIIRTAAEGVGEDELAADVARLQAQWEQISAASQQDASSSTAPQQLYAEPDTLIKVIRDLFNSDINRLLIDGDDAWQSLSAYVLDVAPELADRVSRYVGDKDVFAAFRIDEQISKALQRKVRLPSGGSLVIDRTEAMTVIDVNTGKFTGSGGNLEETVTRNNLEAAEEIVRQLRLRDVGGIIVVDFIDMVLESNRDLVLRRLTECLGRDRTRHQVAEVTSLGLVQMTRKRMGLGLVETFSEPCPQCDGRGLIVHDAPSSEGGSGADGGSSRGRGGKKNRKRGRGQDDAKFEPLVVERVAADAKPDPRGPKPPAVFRAEKDDRDGASDGEAAAAHGTPGLTADDTADGSVTRADDSTDQADGAGDAAVSLEGHAIEPAPRRAPARRRSAGRAAGAPSSAGSAVDIVLPSAGSTDA